MEAVEGLRQPPATLPALISILAVHHGHEQQHEPHPKIDTDACIK
jgi:hypothetical protein